MTDRRLRVVQRGAGADEKALVDALDERSIRVVLPSDPRLNHQILGLALVDLLCRVFPRIDVVVDPDAQADSRLGPGTALLAERFQATRHHGVPPQTPSEPVVTVGVGNVSSADLFADGTGWQSYIGTSPSSLAGDDDGIPIGALCSAARGAAHVFQLALSDFGLRPEPPTCVYWSALDYSWDRAPLDIQRLEFKPELNAVLVGAGSVGGAALYALARLADLRGELTIVDPQSLAPHNLDRALLATAELSEREAVKVEVGHAALAHLAQLRVDARQARVNEFLASRDRADTLPLVLCAVDSPQARRAVQDCLPLDVVNAACHPREVTVSGHRTGAGPCVCCLHMRDVLDSERTRVKLIASATGLNEAMVIKFMIDNVGLSAPHLRGIAAHRGLDTHSLDPYEGVTLETLWREQLMYGGVHVKAGTATVVVAAPWVTALAGFLLAGEALKWAAGSSHLPFRLRPAIDSPGVKYEEAVYASPEFALVTRPPRWGGSECLCRSPRRARLIVERYGLDPAEYVT